jgi:single-strand DNA-binding protein
MMNDLNSILIQGNLVQDPVLRTTSKGTSFCTLSLASNRYYKQDSGLEHEVSYFDVEAWDKLAEYVRRFGSKERGVRIVGRIRQYRWTSGDGTSHSKVVIVAEHIELQPENDMRLDELEAELATAS